MGYSIQYSPDSNRRYPLVSKPKRFGRILLLGLLILALFFAVKYRTELVRLLLPGDPDVTAGALRGLVANLRDGNTGDAIAAFCREIIDNAAG